MNNSSKIMNKLVIWFSICLVIILAGIAMLTVNVVTKGYVFKTSDELQSSYTIEINHDGRATINDTTFDAVTTICNDAISGAKLNTVASYKTTGNSTGSKIVYEINSTVDGKKADSATIIAAMNTAKATIQTNLDADTNYGHCIVSVHESNAIANYSFVWRAAISYGILFIILFVYLCIRYGFAMSLSSMISNLVTVLMVCSFALLCQIAVAQSFVVILMAAAVLSLLVNLFIFNPIKQALKLEENKKLPNAELTEKTMKADLWTILSVVCIVLLGIILVLAIAVPLVRTTMLIALASVVISLFVSLIFTPSLFVFFKNRIKSKDKPVKQPKEKKTQEESAENA